MAMMMCCGFLSKAFNNNVPVPEIENHSDTEIKRFRPEQLLHTLAHSFGDRSSTHTEG